MCFVCSLSSATICIHLCAYPSSHIGLRCFQHSLIYCSSNVFFCLCSHSSAAFQPFCLQRSLVDTFTCGFGFIRGFYFVIASSCFECRFNFATSLTKLLALSLVMLLNDMPPPLMISSTQHLIIEQLNRLVYTFHNNNLTFFFNCIPFVIHHLMNDPPTLTAIFYAS